VFAAQVDGKFNAGDYAGAVTSSEAAKKWATISAVVGGVVVGLYLLFAVALVAGSRGSIALGAGRPGRSVRWLGSISPLRSTTT
jgi:hypothetical protein